MNRPKPVVLIILDGFGIAPSSRANAISLAKTPNFDKYASNYPIMPLSASGEAVGLPWGEMGNSQVGHLSLGSGLIPYQYLPRITKDIISKDFFKNEGLLKACDHAKEKNSALHIMGLVSDGGIHSYNEHLYAILELAKKMIRLSGLQVKDKSNPNGDIEIKYTGVRPGEKLYEELLVGSNTSKTNLPWDELNSILKELEVAINNSDHQELRNLLIKAVPDFNPQSRITDLLY